MTSSSAPRPLFALVDCNSFYASCERLFDPSLEGVPVAVLSGPDGCVICASPELKALGVSVGEPWFIAKHRPGVSAARALPARFELYGDMSRRVMQSLARLGLPMRAYSIDEAFVELPAGAGAAERARWAQALRKACRDCGIPASVGIGSTKTRAKLANAWAKPRAGGSGSFDIEALADSDPDRLGALMAGCPCSSVWGVGPKSAIKLVDAGISNAADLARADMGLLRKLGTIALARCGSELRGTREHPLDETPESARSLSRTRTFDAPMPSHADLAAAISGFVQAACAELRRQGSLAGKAEIFIGTHPMSKRGPARQASAKLAMSVPSNDPLAIGTLASAALRSCFKPGYPYRRAGISFWALEPDPVLGSLAPGPRPPVALPLAGTAGESHPSPSLPAAPLAAPAPPASKRAALLMALDGLRARHGSATVVAAASLTRPGAPGRPRVCCPTTRLADVPVAKA